MLCEMNQLSNYLALMFMFYHVSCHEISQIVPLHQSLSPQNIEIFCLRRQMLRPSA